MRSTFLWIFLLATASGFLVGIVGAAFRFLIEHGYLGFIECTRAIPQMGYPAWPAAALAGAALVSLSVFLTRRFAPEAAGSGIQWMEGTIKGVLPPVRWWRILPVKFVGGVAAMTAGMVLGREGPTIHLGGAIGAMLGRFAAVSDEHRHALIAASAGAGLAEAFNAPAGGILFVAEEMRDDIAYTNVVASYRQHYGVGDQRADPQLRPNPADAFSGRAELGRTCVDRRLLWRPPQRGAAVHCGAAAADHLPPRLGEYLDDRRRPGGIARRPSPMPPAAARCWRHS